MSANQEAIGAHQSAPVFYDDYAVRRFAIMAVVWGAIGMLMGVIIAAQLAFPELNLGLPWTSFGRLRPLHTNAVIFAFGGCALFCHFILCRTTYLSNSAAFFPCCHVTPFGDIRQ